MTSRVAGSSPIVFSKPTQAHEALPALKHVWNATKLGLALAPLTRADLDSIKVYGTMLERTVLELCAARRAITFIPANEPPLLPEVMRHTIATAGCGNIAEALLQLHRMENDLPIAAYHTGHPAPLSERPVTRLDTVDCILMAIAFPRVQNPSQLQDTKDMGYVDEAEAKFFEDLIASVNAALEEDAHEEALAGALDTMSVDRRDCWTEPVPFTDESLRALSHTDRDNFLARGIERLLNGNRQEARLGIWEMRVGACPQTSTQLVLSIPKCNPEHISRTQFAASSKEQVAFVVDMLLQRVASGHPNSREVEGASAALRGISAACGVSDD